MDAPVWDVATETRESLVKGKRGIWPLTTEAILGLIRGPTALRPCQKDGGNISTGTYEA